MARIEVGIAPTPISPGPTWAPITGPISEVKAGSPPKISRQSSASAAAVAVVLDVLDDPGVGAGFMQLAGVAAQPLERPGSGPHPFDRGDFAVDREDRLDLQGAADPGAGAADAAALPQVLEGVDREPHLQLLAHLPARPSASSAAPPASTAAAAASTQRPVAPEAISES